MPRVSVLFAGPSSVSVLPFHVLAHQILFTSLRLSAKLLWVSFITNYSATFHGLGPPSTNSRVTHQPPSSNSNIQARQPPINHSSLKPPFGGVCDLDPPTVYRLRICVRGLAIPRLCDLSACLPRRVSILARPRFLLNYLLFIGVLMLFVAFFTRLSLPSVVTPRTAAHVRSP